MAVTRTAPPDFHAIFEATPSLYMILAPDLTIAAVNGAYANATMIVAGEVVGRGLFEVFPDNPDDLDATGVSNLRASLERVLRTRRADPMPLQKYDVRRRPEEGGGFEQRYWRPINTPVLDASGRVTWIIHRAEDVTVQVDAERRESNQTQIALDNEEAITRLRAANEELERQTMELALRADEIRKLSTPVLQLRDGLLLLPVIGTVDAERASQLVDGLLDAIRLKRAKAVVLDVTGLVGIDSHIAGRLIRTAEAVRLMGSTLIVTGFTAEAAATLVGLGVDLGHIRTAGDLQSGIQAAEELLATAW